MVVYWGIGEREYTVEVHTWPEAWGAGGAKGASFHSDNTLAWKWPARRARYSGER